MSDTPPNPDDELVSAVLDGEATVDEVARVSADPHLSSRLEAFRAVAAEIGRPVGPVDTEARDRRLAMAITASGDGPMEHPGLDTSTVDGPVSLEAARQRRQRRLSIISVAAAIVMVILAVPLLVRIADEPDPDVDLASSPPATATTSTDQAAADDPSDLDPSDLDPSDVDPDAVTGADRSTPEVATAPSADDGQPAAGTAENDVATGEPGTAPVDLGSFPDAASAQAAFEATVRTGLALPMTGPPDPDVAPDVAPNGAAGATIECAEVLGDTSLSPISVVRYTVAGEEREQIVLAGLTAPRSMYRSIEVALADCTVQAVRTFA